MRSSAASARTRTRLTTTAKSTSRTTDRARLRSPPPAAPVAGGSRSSKRASPSEPRAFRAEEHHRLWGRVVAAAEHDHGDGGDHAGDADAETDVRHDVQGLALVDQIVETVVGAGALAARFFDLAPLAIGDEAGCGKGDAACEPQR